MAHSARTKKSRGPRAVITARNSAAIPGDLIYLKKTKRQAAWPTAAVYGSVFFLQFFFDGLFHYKHTTSHRHHRPRAPPPRRPHPAPPPPPPPPSPPSTAAPVRSGPVRSGRVVSCRVVSRHVVSCRVVSRHVVSCRVVSCPVRSAQRRVARVSLARHSRVTRASRTHAHTPLTTDH